MTIADEVARIAAAKSALRVAINAKTPTESQLVEADPLGDFAAAVTAIPMSGPSDTASITGLSIDQAAPEIGDTLTYTLTVSGVPEPTLVGSVVWERSEDSGSTWAAATADTTGWNDGDLARVTATVENAVSSQHYTATLTSAPVAVSAAAGAPADIVINFQNADDDELFANIQFSNNTNGIATVLPSQTTMAGATTGIIKTSKTGTFPWMDVFLDLSAFIGHEVNIEAKMCVIQGGVFGFTSSWPSGGDSVEPRIAMYAEANNSSASQSVSATRSASNGNTVPSVVTSSTTAPHLVSASYPFLRVRANVATNTGGSAGGHPNLSDITVQVAA